MHRQSLGSPGSEHHHALGGGAAGNGKKAAAIEASEESKRLSAATSALAFNGDDKEKIKLPKSQRPSPTASKTNKKNKNSEKLIHGIPVLTLVCFFILYLSSHDPTRSELDVFGGLKRPEVATGTVPIQTNKFNYPLERDWRNASKGRDTAANRRHRNLRGIQTSAASKSRNVHRKLAISMPRVIIIE
uniref:Uncharacterized protein n=1 Tax=Kalanchoe fedtschenkoi TaxID=63787 RepID=A0A7N1A764_KALFE